MSVLSQKALILFPGSLYQAEDIIPEVLLS
jgi:hypothetical protein